MKRQLKNLVMVYQNELTRLFKGTCFSQIFAQGSKYFEKWSPEVNNAAKLISYDNYDWQQAVVDVIILHMSIAAPHERALQENVTYDQLLKMGIVNEKSDQGAAFLEQASGQQSVKVKREEQVRRLQSENKQLKQ